MVSLLAFSGSNRAGSLNQKTVDCLAAMAGTQGAAVESVDLRGLALPIYDGDLEASEGLPAGAATLRTCLDNADGIIVGCPEYNGFMTPLLINAIDWSTRTPEQGADTSPWRDKVILVCSASPGGFGGMRAAAHLKTMLGGIGGFVLPQLVAVPAAFNAFSDDGSLKDEGLAKRAAGSVEKLINVAGRLK